MKNNLIKAFAFIILAAGINVNAKSTEATSSVVTYKYNVFVSNQTGSKIQVRINSKIWSDSINPWSSKTFSLNKFKKIKFRTVSTVVTEQENGDAQQPTKTFRSSAFSIKGKLKDFGRNFYVYGKNNVQSSKLTGPHTLDNGIPRIQPIVFEEPKAS